MDTVSIEAALSYPPRVSTFTQTFWQSLHEGRWTTTRCKSCGHITFPPKVACPNCWSSDQEWIPIGTRGTIYSWTRIHAAPSAFAHEAPYCVCIVDLDDGIRLACKLVESPDCEPAIGMPVEIIRVKYTDGDLFAARLSLGSHAGRPPSGPP